MKGRIQLALALVVWTAGCGSDRAAVDASPAGDDGSASDDASMSACIYPEIDAGGSPPCWPDETPAPGAGDADIVLGTGEDEYIAMPDQVPLVCGPQQGFHIVVHARAEGIEPGDPRNILCPSNPRTRFRAYFVASGEPIGATEIACGGRLAYLDDGNGGLVLQRASAVLFDLAYQEDLFGQDIRVVVEVIDHDGNYATDENIVTVMEPTNWADAGPDSSGCGSGI